MYSMLRLYSSRHNAMSIKDVAIVLDINIHYVAEPISYLIDSGYLRTLDRSIDTNGPLSLNEKLCITYTGELAMREHEQSKKNNFWIEFRAWGTLAIALIALIISIASLLLQWK